MKLEMIPVQSSMLRAIGYDAANQTFVAQFNNGKKYAYYGVPVAVFHNVRDAGSVGEAFNRTVKPNYQFAQLPEG
jgi:hypothetical protein